MTVIVGLATKNKKYLAGDRYIGEENSYFLSSRPKIAKKNASFLIGGAGNAWNMSVCVHVAQLPEIHKSDDPFRFLGQDIFPLLMQTMQLQSQVIDSTEDGACVDLALLFVFRDFSNLYSMDIAKNKLQDISEYKLVGAVGCGSVEAYAAMAALKDSKEYIPKQKLIRTMEVVTELNSFVRPPFDILSI